MCSALTTLCNDGVLAIPEVADDRALDFTPTHGGSPFETLRRFISYKSKSLRMDLETVVAVDTPASEHGSPSLAPPHLKFSNAPCRTLSRFAETLARVNAALFRVNTFS